ncbi:MAG TPA: HAMP domain-containing sensor histidine kinase [Bacteroidia bacterium]|nr:HAMP domain-containing sensor histidine kinase [Bacteroidia bacterium]
MKWNKKNILYLLFAYILFQFLWWEILLVKVHHQLFEKEKQLQALNISDKAVFEKIETQIKQQQKWKIVMIVGEGTVFLILILFGFYKVYKVYQKESEINAQQTNFLLSLPHEIKTPLSVIQLNLQTILQNSKINDEQKNLLTKKSLDELKRLQLLVEQLLISNKISNGKYVLNKQSIHLSEKLEKWIISYNEQKSISTFIEKNIDINADEQLIQLMIQNLLSNAVKYSDKTIEIHLYSKNNQKILEVINDGILISNDEKEKIFEIFYRNPSAENKGIKGTGLGLYLVKEIANLHQFQINVFVKNNQFNVFQVIF